jgi:S-ribosylhomocysteine lyase LuxS involved in autoinducer biosynthesis
MAATRNTSEYPETEAAECQGTLQNQALPSAKENQKSLTERKESFRESRYFPKSLEGSNTRPSPALEQLLL